MFLTNSPKKIENRKVYQNDRIVVRSLSLTHIIVKKKGLSRFLKHISEVVKFNAISISSQS